MKIDLKRGTILRKQSEENVFNSNVLQRIWIMSSRIGFMDASYMRFVNEELLLIFCFMLCHIQDLSKITPFRAKFLSEKKSSQEVKNFIPPWKGVS